MNIIELAKEAGDWNGQTAEFNDVGLERFAALVREAEHDKLKAVYEQMKFDARIEATEREWVELEPWQLCEIEERLGLPIDSHDFETIGNAYIAAFKEKQK